MNKFIVLSGIDENGASVSIKKPASDVLTWAGSDATAAPLNFDVTAIGIDSDGAPTGKVYTYEPTTNAWTNTPGITYATLLGG